MCLDKGWTVLFSVCSTMQVKTIVDAKLLRLFRGYAIAKIIAHEPSPLMLLSQGSRPNPMLQNSGSRMFVLRVENSVRAR